MKNHAVALSLATALLASYGMSPAIAQEAEHDHQHQATATGSPEKKAKKTPSKSAAKPHKVAAGKDTMDMKAMCDMHRQMMSSGSQADRDAMADKEFKGMSAEQKHEHMKMMDEQCK